MNKKMRELINLLEKRRELEDKINSLRKELLKEMNALGLKSRTLVTDRGKFTLSVVERVKVLKKDLLPNDCIRVVNYKIPDVKKIKAKLPTLKGIVEVVKDIQIRFKEVGNE